jgi:TonB-dependent starch-binding outer membrane protein SusC
MRNVNLLRLLRSIARISVLMLLPILMGTALYAQERNVSGVVTDENDQSVPFVNVLVKGSGKGTLTDATGKYLLKVDGKSSILLFRSIGFITQEISVGNSSTINVKLIADVKQLDETVVIGYGVQKRSDLTGSVASVKVDDLTKLPVTGIQSALQGKAAGVQVSQNTGAPGSDVTIRVRGISSLNGSNPLWIVDGVASGANSVNASDIESIEILKDASSAAIYGSNGANGVILITTKKGKPGKPNATLNYYHGIQSVPNRIQMANTQQFANMYTEYMGIKGKGGVISVKDLQSINSFKDDPTYNYQDMIFRTAKMDNLNFNVSGGNDNLSTYFGLGYINQEGILKSSNFERINLRLNSTYKITNWFKVGENISFNQSKRFGWDEWEYNSEYASPVTAAITVHPYLPPYDSVGNWVPRTFGNTDDPMAAIDLMNRENRSYQFNGTVFAKIEPFKGFSYESRLSSNISFGDNYTFNPTYYYGSSLGQYNYISKISRGMNKNTGYTWQNIANYNTTLFKDLNLDVIAGHEVGANEYMDMNGMRQYLLTEDPEMWYFNASTDDSTATQIVTGGASKSAGYSYFGRISLDYKGKYLLQANFRRDYSSKFGPKERVGNFPGISVGWKFTEEKFLKDKLSFLSFGKLRYAYGVAGNSAIRDYAYYGTVGVLTSYKYSFNNSATLATGAGPDVLPNLSIHWEDIVTQNFGLDLGLFDNKLNVTVERFERHNVGMLIPVTLPGYAGWTVRDPFQESANIDPRPIQNIGKISNMGWDVSANYKENIGKLHFEISIAYSNVKNIAADLGSDSIRQGGGFLNMTNICRTQTDGPIGSFYGYKVEKIFQESDMGTIPDRKLGRVPAITNQPYTINAKGDTAYAQPSAMAGDFKFRDLNGDGKITAADQTIIGNPNPKHNLSINLNLEYKIFDLSMFWESSIGNQIFNAAKYYGLNQSGLYNWSAEYVEDHYRGTDVVAKDVAGNVIATFSTNTDAKYPRLDPLNKNGNFDKVSDFYVEDGSYLRLRNIQLGVTIPSRLTNKLSIKGLRFYVGAQNLLTFTKYSGMDPEVTKSDALVAGIDKAAYPQARTILMGLTLNF